jgi:hypothetical protein
MRSLLAVGLACGCAGSPDERPSNWSYIQAAVIAPNCATSSCHSARTAVAGVALDDPNTAYTTLIDRHYVIPGDDTSTLLLLLEGDERRRMPPDAPLPQADIDLVRTWIVEGAAK